MAFCIHVNSVKLCVSTSRNFSSMLKCKEGEKLQENILGLSKEKTEIK